MEKLFRELISVRLDCSKPAITAFVTGEFKGGILCCGKGDGSALLRGDLQKMKIEEWRGQLLHASSHPEIVSQKESYECYKC